MSHDHDHELDLHRLDDDGAPPPRSPLQELTQGLLDGLCTLAFTGELEERPRAKVFFGRGSIDVLRRRLGERYGLVIEETQSHKVGRTAQVFISFRDGMVTMEADWTLLEMDDQVLAGRTEAVAAILERIATVPNRVPPESTAPEGGISALDVPSAAVPTEVHPS